MKVNCQDFKRSQKREVSKEDTKNKTGDEAAEIMEVWGGDYTEPDAAPTENMPWDSGDLSLIKGVIM